jgi:transcriptional regulator with XRE-family HTH domain
MIADDNLPKEGETLAKYVRRIRKQLKLSQSELAQRAGLHSQSIGKIELGKTERLNSKTQTSLAKILAIPEDYLLAVCRGVTVVETPSLKLCFECWQPGTEAETYWLDRRARFCFLCGSGLRDRCLSCDAPIQSLQFRFCPFCGQSYKKSLKTE